MNTPVESLVHDLFMHKDVRPPNPPEVALYSQLRSEPEYPSGGRDRGRLPFADECIDLGRSIRDVITPEFPQYLRLFEHVTRRLGYSVDDFHGYRLRMEYPPMPAIALFRHSLPKGAGSR
jgi:hypothetical protein